MTSTHRTGASVIFAAALYMSPGVSATTGAEPVRTWDFKVYLDDREIGYHRVRMTPQEDGTRVSTEARFDVKFLFISAFRYEHRSDEIWRDACLSGIDARTDKNGDALFVRGEASGDGISVRTHDGEQQLSGCVRSFAYWDPELLQATRLLNAQTGVYQPVQIEELGHAPLDVDGREIDARKYRLMVDKAAVDLWYTADMKWLALESTTRDGYRLRYLPVTETL
jgi:hypothetical protein